MTNIDNQRIAAVRVLDALGYTFLAGEWTAPMTDHPSPLTERTTKRGTPTRRQPCKSDKQPLRAYVAQAHSWPLRGRRR
jgi:hypothetical protein